MPSETSRKARIFLLKATHLPFVALIWAYEGGRSFVSNKVHTPPSMTLASSPARPLSAGGQVRTSRNAAKPQAALRRSTLLAPTTPIRQINAFSEVEHATTSTKSTAEVADLMTLVQKLSSQVEELTSMVAGQQKD